MTSQKKKLRPCKRDGKLLVVLDPYNFSELKPEGETKIMDSYWRKRLKVGDVEEAPPVFKKDKGDK